MTSYGMVTIDPLFEVIIGKGGRPETDNIRLVYDRLDFPNWSAALRTWGARIIGLAVFWVKIPIFN